MFGSPKASFPLLRVVEKRVLENLFKLSAVSFCGTDSLGPQDCNFQVRFHDSKGYDTFCGSSSSNHYNIEITSPQHQKYPLKCFSLANENTY